MLVIAAVLYAENIKAESPPQSDINALAVAQDIQRTNEKLVLHDLWSSKTKWSRFVGAINHADQAWIDVGFLLLPYATGRAKTELQLAFEDALVAAPRTVVGSIGDLSPNLHIICGSSAHLEYDLEEDSVNQRLSAVGSVIAQQRERDRKIMDRLNKCADFLQSADHELRRRKARHGE